MASLNSYHLLFNSTIGSNKFFVNRCRKCGIENEDENEDVFRVSLCNKCLKKLVIQRKIVVTEEDIVLENL
jgi:hypothetical protein